MSALPKTTTRNRHSIGEVRFDLALPAKGSGVKDANDLAWRLRADVLPGIEAALDEFGAALGDFFVERLEIDLGDISMPIDWDAMRRDLQVKLSAALIGQAGVPTDMAEDRAEPREPGAISESAASERSPQAGPLAQSRRAQALGTWLEGIPDGEAQLAWLSRMSAREPRSLHLLLRALNDDPERLRGLLTPMTGSQRVRFAALLGSSDADAKQVPSVEAIAEALREYVASMARAGTPVVAPDAETATRIDVADILAGLRQVTEQDRIAYLASVPADQRGSLLTALTASGDEPAIGRHLALLILSGAERVDGARLPAAGTIAAGSEPDLTGPALLRVWRANPAAFTAEIAALPVSALIRLWRVTAPSAARLPQGRVDEVMIWAASEGGAATHLRAVLTALVLGRDGPKLPVDVSQTGLNEPTETGRAGAGLKSPVAGQSGERVEALDRVKPKRDGPRGVDAPEASEGPWEALTSDAALRLLHEWQAYPEALTALAEAHDASDFLALLERLWLLVDGVDSAPAARVEASTAANATHDIRDKLAQLSARVTSAQSHVDAAEFERLLDRWRSDPAALDAYLAGRAPDELHRLLTIARPWTSAAAAFRNAPAVAAFWNVPVERPSLASVRTAILAAMAGEAEDTDPSRDDMLRGAVAWRTDPALLAQFLQKASGVRVARWIEALSDWAGQDLASDRPVAEPGPVSVTQVLEELAEGAIALGEAAAIAAMDEPAAGAGQEVEASVSRERSAVAGIVADRIAGGLTEHQRRALWHELAQAQTAGDVWDLALDWLFGKAALAASKVDGAVQGAAQSPSAAGAEVVGTDRRPGSLGRLLATWRRDPGSLDRFIDLRGPAGLGRLIQPLAMLASDPDAQGQETPAEPGVLLRDLLGAEPPQSRDKTAPTGVADGSGAGVSELEGRRTAADTDHSAQPIGARAADEGAHTDAASGADADAPDEATSPLSGREEGTGAPIIDTATGERVPGSHVTGGTAFGEDAPQAGVSPTEPKMPPEKETAAGGRAGDRSWQDAGGRRFDPEAGDFKRRAEMLAVWRLDPAEFFKNVTDYSADDLFSLLAGVLSTGDTGAMPPLWQAVTHEAGRSRDARAYLKAVLQRIARQEPLDPRALAEEIDAVAVGDPEARLAAKGPEPFEPGSALLPLAELLDMTEAFDDAWADEVLAAALLEKGGIAQALGSARHGLIRAARLVERMTSGDLERLADALRRGMAAKERDLVRLLWQALPDDLMAPGLSKVTRWQFNLLFADGAFARSGGVSGLVSTALDWLAGRSATRGRMVAALLDAFTDRKRDSEAAAVAQLISALRRVAGALSAPPMAVFGDDADQEPVQEDTPTAFTQSAGLVLLSPYLPRLFERLDLTASGAFRDEDALFCVFDVLHCVLHGQEATVAAPRPLEKLLCGVPRDVPLRPTMPLDDAASEIVEGMLGAVLQQWSALGGTSVDGLRESFLRREGLLETRDDLVRLKVAPKPYDMLLDRLPWSYGVVKFPWMETPLHVDWRNADG